MQYNELEFLEFMDERITDDSPWDRYLLKYDDFILRLSLLWTEDYASISLSQQSTNREIVVIQLQKIGKIQFQKRRAELYLHYYECETDILLASIRIKPSITIMTSINDRENE